MQPNKHSETQTCDGDIKNCTFADHFLQIFSNEQNDNIEIINFILNIFLHLVCSHGTDAEFMYLYQQLKHQICDVRKCEIFRRNYRNRNPIQNGFYSIKKLYKMNDNDTESINHRIALQQIMDKIHCYYLHCYDIGHRINDKEMGIIQQRIESNKGEPDLINQHLREIKEYLSTKHTLYSSVSGARSVDVVNRFTTTPIQDEKDIDQTDTHNDICYSFGLQFKYDTDDSDDGVIVAPKYSSLKEEMTQNRIISMNVHQFNREYQKAVLHHNSYCRLTSSQISLHSILALLIHCNYNGIQFEFNKSYRKIQQNESIQSIANRHCNFYFFGKYLKESMKSGTHACKGICKSFYHGISQRMVFSQVKNATYTRMEDLGSNQPDPEYIKYLTKHLPPLLLRRRKDGISIHSPLSTSTSYAVAVNFATSEGIVVEFTGCCRCKYISVNWISDFGNEQELLFVQSAGSMNIKNIVMCTTGLEMKSILEALQLITFVFGAGKKPDKMNDRLIKLAKSIVHHQLSLKSISFVKYAKTFINAYFLNSNEMIRIDWEVLNESAYRWLWNIIGHSEYEWIKLDVLNMIFPRAQTIEIYGASVSEKVLDGILSYLSTTHSINHIEFGKDRSNDTIENMQRNEYAIFYKQRFEAIGFSIDYDKRKRSDLVIKHIASTINGVQTMVLKHEPKFIII